MKQETLSRAGWEMSLKQMPLAKVLGAYYHLSANMQPITKENAILWLVEKLMDGQIDWPMVVNAPSAAGAMKGVIAPPQAQKADPAIARALDQSKTAIQGLQLDMISVKDSTARLSSELGATTTKLDSLYGITSSANRQTTDELSALNKSFTDLRNQVSGLNGKIGKFSLDESQINSAVAQVIDDAFAPFRKAVEDAGMQEVVADMSAVRVIERRPALDVFGVEVTDVHGNPLMVDIWNHPAAPDVDPMFIWTRPILEDLLGVQDTGENLWFGGDRGTGKSETARQFAARTGRNFARVNYHKHSSADEFIGAVGLENGATVFKPGSFLQAFMTPSTVILNDEISNAPEGELATLNPLLEPNCAVVYGGAVRRRAPGVMIFAADNTLGNGDESGRYAGTRTMNSALVDRFARIIQFQYLPLAEEVKAVVNHTGCTPELAKHILECINVARSKVSDGEIIDAPSIRSVIAFIRALKTKSVQNAWMSCVVQRQPAECKAALIAIAETCLDSGLILSNI